MMFLLSINVMAQDLGNQLSEGDTKTFKFCEDNGDCGNYGVQVNYIGYNNIIDKNVVKLEVNGESIIMLSENESYTLADGSVLSITDILNQDFAGGVKTFWFLIDGKQGTEVDQEISEEIEISPVSKPVDLSNYPDLFVKNSKLNFFLVVGTNSPSSDNLALSDIAVSFEKAGYKFKNAAKLDSEVSNPLNTNLIVFGKASDNTISDLLVGSVNNLLSPGEGMIKLFENNGKVQLLITGLTPDDTRKAAKVLQNYKDYGLSGKEVIVTGSMSNPQVKKSTLPVVVTPAKPEMFNKSQSRPEPTPQVEVPPKAECVNGCKANGNCLPYGTRLVKDEKQVYCSIDRTLQEQQGLDADCQNNYECSSNQCNNGLCVNLQQLSEKLDETNSLLARILAWIEKIFG